MLLYDVPQTDQPTEPAMASMVARLRTTCPKPEALAGVVDATVAIHLAMWVKRVSNALSDRATLPLLQWDADLDGCAITLASRRIYNMRGRNRQAGADEGIDVEAEEAMAYLRSIGPGAEGERVSPNYIDSNGNVPLDGPKLSTMPTADAWARAPDPTGITPDRSLHFPWP
jgi:hypothetical protein